MRIIIDTREKTPWHFGDLADVLRGTLSAGDYALEGDSHFAIERKSLDDYVQTITSGWKRFELELERMQYFPVKVVIVEADWIDLIRGNYVSSVPAPAVIARTAELIMDGVSILFCSDPIAAAGLCWRVLLERKKRLEKRKKQW